MLFASVFSLSWIQCSLHCAFHNYIFPYPYLSVSTSVSISISCKVRNIFRDISKLRYLKKYLFINGTATLKKRHNMFAYTNFPLILRVTNFGLVLIVSCWWLPNNLQPNMFYKRKVTILFLTKHLTSILCVKHRKRLFVCCLHFDIKSFSLFSKLFHWEEVIFNFFLNISSILLG